MLILVHLNNKITNLEHAAMHCLCYHIIIILVRLLNWRVIHMLLIFIFQEKITPLAYSFFNT